MHQLDYAGMHHTDNLVAWYTFGDGLENGSFLPGGIVYNMAPGTGHSLRELKDFDLTVDEGGISSDKPTPGLTNGDAYGWHI